MFYTSGVLHARRSLILRFFFAAVWFTLWFKIASAWLWSAYPHLQPDAAFLAGYKRAQYRLLMSGWLGALCFLCPCPPLRGLTRQPWAALACVALGAAVLIGAYGVLPVLAFAVGVTFLARKYAQVGAEQRPRSRAALLLCGVLFAALFVVSLRRTDYRVIDLYDDGPILSAVNESLHGRRAYRDILLQYGPLRDIVQPRLAFALWGTTYDAEQKIRAWVQTLGFLFLFGIVVQGARSRGLAIAAGILLLIRRDLFLPERTMPVLAAAFCAVRAFALDERPAAQRRWAVAAGIASLAALLYTFEMGFTWCVGVAAFGVLWTASPGRPSGRAAMRGWLWGFAGAAAVFFGVLLVRGGFVPFWTDLYALLTERLGTWSDLMHSRFFIHAWPARRVDAVTYVSQQCVPVLAVLTAGYALWKKRAGQTAPRVTALGLLAVALFFQFFVYVGRSDFNHWKNATPLLWPLVLLAIDAALDALRARDVPRLDRGLAIGASAVVLMPLASLAWGRAPLWSGLCNGIVYLDAPSEVVPRPAQPDDPPRLGPVGGSAQDLSLIRHVTQWVQQDVPPDGSLFLFMNWGGFYFLADRMNPTRFGLVDYVHGQRMTQECLRDLARRPPQAVLVYYESTASPTWYYREDLEPIAAWIRARYHLQHRENLVGVLVPNP